MLKQINTLGLMLVIIGMLVGCEDIESTKIVEEPIIKEEVQVEEEHIIEEEQEEPEKIEEDVKEAMTIEEEPEQEEPEKIEEEMKQEDIDYEAAKKAMIQLNNNRYYDDGEDLEKFNELHINKIEKAKENIEANKNKLMVKKYYQFVIDEATNYAKEQGPIYNDYYVYRNGWMVTNAKITDITKEEREILADVYEMTLYANLEVIDKKY